MTPGVDVADEGRCRAGATGVLADDGLIGVPT